MKTNGQGNQPQLSTRNEQKQSLRQRYILTGISVMLTITAGIMYWMLQQREAAAISSTKPAVHAITSTAAIATEIKADIEVDDNVPVIYWEGDFPAGSMFVIERSADAEAWELVQKAPREEVMTQDEHFRFRDEEAEGANLRYRISCVDGTNRIVSTTELETGVTHASDQLLTITAIDPLPFENQFTLSVEAEKEEVISFEILDSKSTAVYSEVYRVKKGDNMIGFTRGEMLPKGVYIIRLSGSDEAIAMTKLMKN